MMTEIIHPKDDSFTLPQMTTVKRKEIYNLLSRGTFKVTLREDITPGVNVLPGRFVLAIKSTEDGKSKLKYRYVIGGHRDKFKDFIVHSSKTLQTCYIRFLLEIESGDEFIIWTANVRPAYLPLSEQLLRDVFIKNPGLEF